jgi:fructose/tagatose bisphosphate aldolase
MLQAVPALRRRIAGVLELPSRPGGLARVLDEDALRAEAMDDLARTAALSPDEGARTLARWAIMEAGRALGVLSASIHDAYLARGRGAWGRATVPAINIRARTYDTARALYRAALARDARLVVCEIARSEIGYTFQRPAEYAACVMAAALREGYPGPVFIQGDHFQASAKKVAQDAEAEMRALEELVSEAVAAGFMNIDIDTSTLVDLSKPTVAEQQRVNFELGARLTRHVRKVEPDGVTISVGGEIGEVGKQNSTVEELRAYLDGFEAAKGDVIGISKVSVQTGTTHGGMPLADGRVADVKLDFGALEELSRCCRGQYGLAGAVQHGASTLPDELFDRFPATDTAEIHLATGFQNIVFDHPALPPALRSEMNAWLEANAQQENKPGYTKEQFLFKARKWAWGPFKQAAWDLPGEAARAIDADLEAKFAFYIDALGVAGSRKITDEWVRAADFAYARPAGA